MKMNDEMIKYIIDNLDEILNIEEIRGAIIEKINSDKLEDKYYSFSNDDLIGNIFFTLKKNLIYTNKISLDLVDKYKDILTDIFNMKYMKVLFKNTTDENIDEEKIYTIDENKDIILNDNITLEYLIDKYQSVLPLDILLVILDSNVVAQLIKEYNNDNVKKLIFTNTNKKD